MECKTISVEIEECTLMVLDPIEGHTEKKWNPTDLDSFKEAEELFKKKINVGWMAFKLAKNKLGERITKFDPKAPKILMLPPLGAG